MTQRLVDGAVYSDSNSGLKAASAGLERAQDLAQLFDLARAAQIFERPRGFHGCPRPERRNRSFQTVRRAFHRLNVAASDSLMEFLQHPRIILHEQLRDFLEQFHIAANPGQSQLAIQAFPFRLS